MKRPFVSAGLLIALALSARQARAADGVDVAALTAQTAKSLVEVEYTYQNDNVAGRQEYGQGILLNKEGVILISGSFISEAIPKDFIKDIKVRYLGKQFKEVSATFLGRTTDRLFAYVKADEPLGAEPFSPGTPAEAALGMEVAAVAINGRLGGYTPAVGVSRIKTIVPYAHDVVITGTFGLVRATSPVFDIQTGKLVGMTLPPVGESLQMSMISNGQTATLPIQLRDEDQSSVFLPWSEIKEVFDDIPTKPFDARRPWIGLDSNGIAGVEEDMRKLNNIEQTSAVTVGSLIPGGAAEKGGMKTRDIVLAVNGKEFSKSVVPEIMVSQFTRALEKLKIGEEATLTVLRDGKKVDVKMTVEPSPKLGAEMPMVTNAKLGLVTRDLAFFDTYNRKLPADTKGVIVVLVKQGAPAAMGTTPLRAGVLITKINDQPIADEKDFDELLKKATAEGATEVVFVVTLGSGETQVCRIDLTK